MRMIDKAQKFDIARHLMTGLNFSLFFYWAVTISARLVSCKVIILCTICRRPRKNMILKVQTVFQVLAFACTCYTSVVKEFAKW